MVELRILFSGVGLRHYDIFHYKSIYLCHLGILFFSHKLLMMECSDIYEIQKL